MPAISRVQQAQTDWFVLGFEETLVLGFLDSDSYRFLVNRGMSYGRSISHIVEATYNTCKGYVRLFCHLESEYYTNRATSTPVGTFFGGENPTQQKYSVRKNKADHRFNQQKFVRAPLQHVYANRHILGGKKSDPTNLL